MDGVQFLINEDGEKTAVLLDLQKWGDLWEGFYDTLVSRSRAEEGTVSWNDLTAEIEQETTSDDTV